MDPTLPAEPSPEIQEVWTAMLSSRDRWWVTQAEAALQSQGLTARFTFGPHQQLVLIAPERETVAVVSLLSVLWNEEWLRRRERPTRGPTSLWLDPNFAAALLCAAVLLIGFIWVGGAAQRLGAFVRGAYDFDAWVAGEWWRPITASLLHADLGHVVSNGLFFLVLAWAAMERVGVGAALALWLCTAVFGFFAGSATGEAFRSVGASGGIFGLLGASAGHGVRYASTLHFERREKFRIFGAAILLIAMSAFGKDSNISAHLGGAMLGGLLGALLPRKPLAPMFQIVLGAAAIAIPYWAWRVALTPS